MIKGSVEKLALLCAAAGITASEWEDFVTEVRQAGSDETRRLYNRIRNQIKALEKSVIDQDSAVQGSFEHTSSSVVRDISRLIDGADVSTPTAARRISYELKRQYPDFDEEMFRFNSKDGLRRWLNKVIKEYGENAILSAAASAFRGRHSDADWRLK